MTIKRITQTFILLAIVSICAASFCQAAVSPEEAKKLGTTLTRFGAEKAGNPDGSIPPYTGGLQPVPGYNRAKMQVYIHPYLNEKPIYSITQKNMAQYDKILTDGTKALLRKYPSYSVDVYPTHRSMRYLDWILDNTEKNATTAKMGGAVMGDAITGTGPKGQPFPGVPFPIPQNGYEVMWNHKLAFTPVLDQRNKAYIVDSRGGISDLPNPHEIMFKPWYDKSGWLRENAYNAVFGFFSQQMAPPRSAGIVFLNFYLPTAEAGGQKVWFYTPGQRRCRVAPDFAYDLPISAYGGVTVWDEIFGFVGRLDRYDFKLVGKKEMIIPYNAYTMTQVMPSEKIITKGVPNPDALRFEKHRVWVVEADRKAGQRHMYKKRMFYIDEDSWQIAATDSYDDSGKLWRTGQIHTFAAYDVGGMNNLTWVFHDIIKDNYAIFCLGAMEPNQFNRHYMDPNEIRKLNIPLTPQAVEARMAR